MDSEKYFKLSDSEKRRVLLEMREQYLASHTNGDGTNGSMGGIPFPIRAVSSDTPLEIPLTEIQASFLISKYFNRNNDHVGCHIYLEISETNLDEERLRDAWNRLIDRHDMLSARIMDGERQVIVRPVSPAVFACHDLRNADSHSIASHVEDCRARLQQKVYNVEDWPLYTIEISQLPNGEAIIHFSIDEWIVDGASLLLLLKEWHQLYTGIDSKLPRMQAGFAAYARALKREELEEKSARDLAYWQARLTDIPPGPVLPVAFDGESGITFNRRRMSRRLGKNEWRTLSVYCKRHRLSPTALLLTVFCRTLEQFSESKNFSLLLTLFNRLPLVPRVEEIVGPFISSGFYFHSADDDTTIQERIGLTQEQLWENLDHGSVSAISVLRDFKNKKRIPPGFSIPVVFTSMLHSAEKENADEENWIDRISYSVTQTPEVYLDHQTFVRKDELFISWDYALEYFNGHVISDLMDNYLALLRSIVNSIADLDRLSFSQVGAAEPDRINLIPADEKHRFEAFPLTDVQQAYFVSQSSLLTGDGLTGDGLTGDGLTGDASTADALATDARSCLIYQEIDIADVSVCGIANAWAVLVDHHDALRTVITADGKQRACPSVANTLIRHLDLSTLDDAQRQTMRRDIRAEMEALHFTLEKGPFWDVRISSDTEKKHRLHVAIDMLICDANSMQLILRQLIMLLMDRYPLFSRLRYRDVLLHRKTLENAGRQKTQTYWQERLQRIFPAPGLPISGGNDALRSRRERFEAVVDGWSNIVAVAEKLEVAPSTIVLAAYTEVLLAWSDNQPFTLVVVNWNRPAIDPGIDDVAGDFTELSWLQVDAGNASFRDRIFSIHKQLCDDQAHGGGFAEFRRMAMKNRKATASYPVVFTNFMPHGKHILPENIALGYGLSQTPGVFLDNISHEINGRLHLHWDARTDRLPSEMVDGMFRGYTAMLSLLGGEVSLANLESTENTMGANAWCRTDWNDVLQASPETFRQLTQLPGQDSDAITGEVNISIPQQAQQLQQQKRWNRTERDYPLEKCLHYFIEQQVKREPYRIALQYENQTISFLELNERANRLAHFIRQHEKADSAIVAVVLDRSIEMVVSLLAALKAGAAYLPVDPDHPEDRIAFIVSDAGAKLVLSAGKFSGKLAGVTATVILLDRQEQAISRCSAQNPGVFPTSDQIAYVIYTSGSTGKPKGCLVSHSAIVNRLLWMRDEYQVGGQDRILQKTPYTFDVSVWEFFLPLLSGATMVLAKPGGHRDAAYLVQLIRAENVTICHFVPSMLGAFLREENVGACKSLSRVFTSGEALPYGLVEKFLNLLPARLHNLYGPTEAAVDVSYWPCQLNDNKQVLIGRPVANTQLYVTDENLNPLPAGEIGELLIGGVQVAKGYLGRPELTAQKFITDPFSDNPTARLYRTGDYARFLPDGNIEFMGRMDTQVKLRGLRIELGEIENQLLGHPDIGEAVVRVRDDGDGDPKLVACVVGQKKPSDLTLKDIRGFLKSSLPEYMLPNMLVVLDSLPVTAHGKLDGKKLEEILHSGGSIPAETRENSSEEPEAATETIDTIIDLLAGVLRQALSVEHIEPTDDLFDLGVTSLTLVKVAQQVRQHHGVDIPVEVFLDSPRIKAIAEYIHARISKDKPAVAAATATGRGEAKASSGKSVEVILDAFGFDEEIYARFGEKNRFDSRPVSYADFCRWMELLSQREINGQARYRYASGGGKNAVQAYLYIRENRVESLEQGFYYYHPSQHAIIKLPSSNALEARLFNEAYRPAFEQSAFAVFLIAEFGAIEPFYADASTTLVELDTGYMTQLLQEHAAQNQIGLLTVDDFDFSASAVEFLLSPSHRFITCLLGGSVARRENEVSQTQQIQIAPSEAFRKTSAGLRSLKDIDETSRANRYSTLTKEERDAVTAQCRHLRNDLLHLPRVELRRANTHANEYTLRQCIRDYIDEPLSTGQLGHLLSLLKRDNRTGMHLVPTGALPHQVDAYVFIKENGVAGLAAGLYFYEPEQHRLRLVRGDVAVLAEEIKSAHVPFNRTHYLKSRVNIFLLANLEKTPREFGNYGIRKAYIEAGRIGQLLMQHQSELDLGICPIGGMRFDKIEKYFDIQDQRLFLHCLLVGGWRHEGRVSSPLFSSNETVRTHSTAGRASQEKLAIIGLAGRYPGADTLEEYERLLASGKSAISRIPTDRWDGERFLSREADDRKSYTQWGGFLKNIRRFDSLLFQISPMEARLIDPQERLFMEVVWECLENAGYSARSLKQTAPRVGVFVGVMWNDYQSVAMQGWNENNIRQAIGFHSSIANRVSHFFDFEGPSIALDTSCSSALSALHMARQSIAQGECDAAIVGGVNLIGHPYHQNILCGLGLLSQSDTCYAFGENGTGWVVGEGVGAMLVRPESEAKAGGDHIHANICGTAVCHSGKTMRYGFPAAEKQAKSIAACMSRAGIDPAEISYIESAATGSGLADAVEAEAIKSVFSGVGDIGEKNVVAIGSVKPNIGHLESASFISQLTKVVLQFRSDRIFPSINSEPRNPLINYDGSSLFINTEAKNWTEILNRSGKRKRYALINSFGATGSSGHVILEEAGAEQPRSSSDPVVIPLSANDDSRLRLVADRLRSYLTDRREGVNLANVAFTLQMGRAALRERTAFIASTVDELIEQLTDFLDGKTNALSRDTTLHAMARAWSNGESVEWSSLHTGNERRTELPSYPFLREEHWLDPSDGGTGSNTALTTSSFSRAEAHDRKFSMQAGQQIMDKELLNKTRQYLLSTYAKLSGIDQSRIDADASLIDYGINSLIIKAFNVEMDKHYSNVSKTVLFECQSINDLADYLLGNHFEETARLLGHSATRAEIPKDEAQRSTGFERSGTSVDRRADNWRHQDIAIIGIAGRYPGANNIEAFWENLYNGRDCIVEVPAERWDYRKYTPKNRWGGFIDNVDKFDSLFFNISPAEAKLMDPQERQFLEVAWESLEDSGYTRDALKDQFDGRVGVFVGVMYGEYQLFGAEQIAKNNLISVSSCYGSIANRVSYALNLKGPSMAVDTLCSSSLTAVHLAVRSIRHGDCDVAIVGGVNLSLHPNKYIMHAQMNMPSSNGRCMAFGNGGDGFVPGEGVGAVILKPLDRARQDGDRIYAIVKGSSLNHDGKTNGYTVPNPVQQGELIRTALHDAQIDPSTISYIEAHGTGTSLGDPIEITGLTRAFGDAAGKNQYCAIGSVKSNIGHLESASGIASMTKVVLQMQHKKLVPSLHAQSLNPNIDFENSAFRVQRQLEDWLPQEGGVRRAAISSFGAGGANAHVILEEFCNPREIVPVSPSDREHLFVLSARNKNGLREYVNRWIDYLDGMDGEAINFENAIYTAQVGREAMRERLAVIARNAGDLASKLKALDWRSDDGAGIYLSDASKTGTDLGKLFDGEESGEILNVLLRHGSLRKLAMLWVDGIRIDWALLHREPKQKISIPKYPFARERHWLVMDGLVMDGLVMEASIPRSAIANMDMQGIHPLLDENISDLNTLGFKKTFTRQSAFVDVSRDEKYYSVGPAVMIEMLHAASSRLSGGKRLVKINSLNWAGSWIDALEPAEMVLRYHAKPGSDLVQVLGKVAWKSRVENALVAELEFSDPDKIKISDNYLDCKKVRARCPEHIAPGSDNALVREFHWSEAEALVNLAVDARNPASGRDDEFLLGPPLLQAALKSVIAFHEKIYPEDRNNVLETVSIDRIDIRFGIADSCALHIAPSERWDAGVEEYAYDLSLVDAAGRTAISIEGLVLKPVVDMARTDDSLVSTSMELSSVCYLENQWKESPLNQASGIGGITLVFESGKSLSNALRQQQEANIILVTPGNGFQRIESTGNSHHFEINVGQAADYEKLFDNLAKEELVIGNVIHYWSKAGFDVKTGSRQADESVKSLFHIARNIRPPRSGESIKFTYLFEANEPQPYYESCAAFLKSLSYENPKIKVKAVCLPAVKSKMKVSDLARIAAGELSMFSAHEYEIRYESNRRLVKTYQPCKLDPNPALGLRKAGVYLVTGGVGGLGRLFARWLCATYQAKIVLVGRRDANREVEAELRRLKHAGGQAIYIQCDVADEKSVRQCRDSALAAFGEINGIVHAAGILRDGMIVHKTVEHMDTVLESKVTGSVVLDKVFAAQALDFVAYFSSIVGVLGNVGQSDYAYANAFQDHFARYRNELVAAGKRSGRTLSINWPLWSNGGMSTDRDTETRMEAMFGFVSMSSRSGIKAFEEILQSGREKVIVINGYPTKIAETLGIPETRLGTEYDNLRLSQSRLHAKLLPLINDVPTGAASADPDKNLPDAVTDAAGIDSGENIGLATVSEFLLAQVAEATGVDIDQIDRRLEFWELGLDSILSMKIIESIESRWNLRLYPNEMLEYNNIDKLAAYLLGEISSKLNPKESKQTGAEQDEKVEIISSGRSVQLTGDADATGQPAPEIGPDIELSHVRAFLTAEISQTTGVPEEDINTSLEFWELGLDSILSMKIIENIEHKYGIRLYPNEMLEYNNLEKLSAYLRNEIKHARSASDIAAPEADSESAVEIITSESAPTPVRKPGGNARRESGGDKKVVFVLSTPRSGSTLFRVMLEGHSEIFSPPELHLLPYETLNDWDRRLAELNQRHIKEGLTKAVAELESLSADQAVARIKALQDSGFTVRQTYDLLLNLAGGRYVVDKSPNHALDLATLRRAELVCDEPLYIHLIRHPISVIESFVRNRFDKMFAIKEDPWRYAESLWCDMNRNIRDFLQQVPYSRQKFIVYEDLVTRPEPVMRSLCDWLGISYEDGMVNPYEGDRMTSGLHENSLSIGDPNFNKRGKIESQLAENWKRHADKISNLKFETISFAREFGYFEDLPAEADTLSESGKSKTDRSVEISTF